MNLIWFQLETLCHDSCMVKLACLVVVLVAGGIDEPAEESFEQCVEVIEVVLTGYLAFSATRQPMLQVAVAICDFAHLRGHDLFRTAHGRQVVIRVDLGVYALHRHC